MDASRNRQREQQGSAFTRWRAAFRAYRHTRPFWAGLFCGLSGIAILVPTYATVKLGNLVVSISTLGGASALLLGVVLLICAASLWVAKQFRFVAGLVAIICAVVALAAANLGGFVVGTLLGLLGGALAIAWSPKRPEELSDRDRHGEKRARRRRSKHDAGLQASASSDSAAYTAGESDRGRDQQAAERPLRSWEMPNASEEASAEPHRWESGQYRADPQQRADAEQEDEWLLPTDPTTRER